MALDPPDPPEQLPSTEPATGNWTQPDPDQETKSFDAGQASGAGERPTELCAGAGIDGQVDPSRFGRYVVRGRLGEGGFGRVYLAWDEDLKRTVAIKVPRAGGFSSSARVERFLNEARLAAQLRHPGIVSVYDVGREGDGTIYVVLEHVGGRPLSAVLSAGDFPLKRAIDLLAKVADALHCAHRHGLVHRDLNPNNILLDLEGSPRVADFGLAIHEDSQALHLGEVAGTAPYMAPEQVRGETHRLDGRTDIWALGVILYLVLTGRKPFAGEINQLWDEIRERDPKPPRQINDSAPKELERICLKCLSKRMTDRYNSALDLADDLRHFQKTEARAEPAEAAAPDGAVQPLRSAGRVPASALATSYTSGTQVRIVPKGLCSFDEHDADFFLDLLPGPRDRDALPESIRFWKIRVDATDPDKTFCVGLVYGPSGCGKSSLFKAGLLPRLGGHVAPVYTEATIEQTEARLLRGVRKLVPALPHDIDLARSLALLRGGDFLTAGQRVLIVLDQFEQWLFGRPELDACELVTALKQCDGEHIQAICLVRDDFWMTATRFFRELEIELVPDRNVASVDLFDARHARRVLAAYGRAFGAFPQHGDFSAENKAFLDQAVAGLLQDGRVVPVRLALFAEMVKDKPWTTATLDEVGGMGGIGLRFLDETFSSARSNPTYRYHQNAAQSVLKSLLPAGSTDIKGRMRSVEELRDISGYTDKPADFASLMRILDHELRLITPVDLEQSVAGEAEVRPPGGGFYQLAHDYLVHSLRDWLTRKQRETRRGRAEAILAERAEFWNAKPEHRQLPTLMEWASIRSFTKPSKWTEPEGRMMRTASRSIGLRAAGFAVLFIGVLAAAWEMNRRSVETNNATHAAGLVQQLLKAEIAQVPGIVENLQGYRRWTDPELKRVIAQSALDSKEKLHASIALLPVDPRQVDYLLGRALIADPGLMAVLRDSLQPHRTELVDRLWRELDEANSTEPLLRDRVLPIAGLLASLDPENARWKEVGGKVARAMVTAKIDDLAKWLEALENLRKELTVPLIGIFRDKSRTDVEHTVAATLLARYAEHQPRILVDLLLDAEPKSFAILFPVIEKNRKDVALDFKKRVESLAGGPPVETFSDNATRDDPALLRDQRSLRGAKAALALFRLGAATDVWHLLVHSADPSTRSFLINAFHVYGADPSLLAAKLENTSGARPSNAHLTAASTEKNAYLFDPATSTQRSLIMALAGYPKDMLDPETRARLDPLVVQLFRTAPDAGVHSAAELLLKRWGHEDRLKIDAPAPNDGEPFKRRWYITSQRQTMVLIEGPVDFAMGSPSSDLLREPEEVFHTHRIPRRFAIATREVTVGEFQRYLAESRRTPQKESTAETTADEPQCGVTWFDAIGYCNWLSAKEGKPLCYEPNEKGEFAQGMKVNMLPVEAGGYRLPTEAEWEYACRAGTVSSRYFGNPDELASDYEWYSRTSGYRAHRCGTLLPNDLGLFDLLGNVFEWCHDHHVAFPPKIENILIDQINDECISMQDRCTRSDSFRANPRPMRSASRGWFDPGASRGDVGFRPARTCP
jgi:formylglycine-generating enzyme required for sulfatase activity